MKKNLFFILLFFSLKITAQDLSYRDIINVLNYHIKLDLSDLSSGILRGETVLRITTNYNQTKYIALDLEGLNVDKVLLEQKAVAFTHENNILKIPLQKAINRTDTLELSVFYYGIPQKDKSWGGFFISDNYAFNYGIGMDAVPPNYGRVWFPCIDNFTDRAFYEYSVKVKKGNMAACPGILQEVIQNEDGTETWHWKLHQSIPTYLSSVAVSDYEAFKDTVQGINRKIPVEIFINKQEFNAGKKSFVHVKDFLHAFENAFGAYVWDKIGYVSTPFKGGAMEHATNIAYSANCNGSLQCENTLAHELSHHWFGNLVTCRTEKDMWLNEGWASYCEAIFREYYYGKEDALKYNRQRHKQVLQFAHLYDGGYLPLYGISHENTYGFTIYKKGADVAMALRSVLGDSLFFSALKQYFINNAFTDISVNEFRIYMEKQTGIDLSDFFDFWVYNPGFPHFSAEYFNVKKFGNAFSVSFKINQRLKKAPDYLKTPLEIFLVDKNRQIHKFTINLNRLTENIVLTTAYEPLLLMINPDGKIPDATTKEYQRIYKPDNYNFPDELISLKINQLTDSAFVAITHHWISPQFNTKQGTVYDFAERYWSINYIAENDFSASANFGFDLSYALDKNLAKYGYERLHLLYRKNEQSDWEQVNAKLVKGRKAYFVLDSVKQGSYTLAAFK